MDQRFTEITKQPLPFENCAYELRITGTKSTDKRIMSFVNLFWGFEVTGGTDQYEPLTVINVCYFGMVFFLAQIIFSTPIVWQVDKTGMARRAGIRIGDIITRINNTYAEGLTMTEAQRLINQSKRHVQIFVWG